MTGQATPDCLTSTLLLTSYVEILLDKFCCKCNRYKPSELFFKNKKTSTGLSSWCKVCTTEYNRKYLLKSKVDPAAKKAHAKAYKQTSRGAYVNRRYRALYTKHEFTLTYGEFMMFWQKPCYYCNDPVRFVGLDRVDNTKGYVLSNVVSCCETCNRMKLTQTQNDFLLKCQKIALNKHNKT